MTVRENISNEHLNPELRRTIWRAIVFHKFDPTQASTQTPNYDEVAEGIGTCWACDFRGTWHDHDNHVISLIVNALGTRLVNLLAETP